LNRFFDTERKTRNTLTTGKAPRIAEIPIGGHGMMNSGNWRRQEMPIYVYELILPNGDGGEQFERLQPMSAAPFATHPETGEPCRRIFGTPNAPRAWTDSQAKDKTSDASLKRGGFTKYVKTASGKYEKTFGKGPDKLGKPPGE